MKRALGESPLTNNTRVMWYEIDGKYGYEFTIIHKHAIWLNGEYDGMFAGGDTTIIDLGAIYPDYASCKAAMTRLYQLLNEAI